MQLNDEASLVDVTNHLAQTARELSSLVHTARSACAAMIQAGSFGYKRGCGNPAFPVDVGGTGIVWLCHQHRLDNEINSLRSRLSSARRDIEAEFAAQHDRDAAQIARLSALVRHGELESRARLLSRLDVEDNETDEPIDRNDAGNS